MHPKCLDAAGSDCPLGGQDYLAGILPLNISLVAWVGIHSEKRGHQMEKEIASLSAETLAMQTILASVFFHLGRTDPKVQLAIQRGLNDAANQVEDLAIRLGKSASPDHVVKAIRVVEEIRAASLSDKDQPRHGV
jgi:hypothetical protein